MDKLAQGCPRDESRRVLPWVAIDRKTPSLKGKHTGRGFCSSPLGMWMDGETSTQGNASRASRQPWADLSIPFGENVQTPGPRAEAAVNENDECPKRAVINNLG